MTKRKLLPYWAHLASIDIGCAALRIPCRLTPSAVARPRSSELRFTALEEAFKKAPKAKEKGHKQGALEI